MRRPCWALLAWIPVAWAIEAQNIAEIRLSNTRQSYAGHLLTYLSEQKQWAHVCSNAGIAPSGASSARDDTVAAVACRQLGYEGGSGSTSSEPIERAFLSYTVSAKLSCDAAPNGTSLTECEWVTLSSGEVCTRNRLLRVTCSPLQYGDVRLSGQGGARQGQVMVYTASGQWLYPCGTMFDAASAAVVCDHLGYSGADRFTLGGGTPVIQVGPTTGWWPDSFSCTGKERNLTQCSDGALSSCGASVSDARRNIPILVCNQVQNADVVLPIAVGSFVIALCCGVATCSAVFCCCRRVETGGPRRGIVHGLGARWPLNRKAAARHRRGAGARREGGPADVVGLPALYPPPPPPPPPAETKEGGGGGTVASRRHAGGGRGGGASVAAHV